jgi:hypothetical protein
MCAISSGVRHDFRARAAVSRVARGLGKYEKGSCLSAECGSAERGGIVGGGGNTHIRPVAPRLMAGRRFQCAHPRRHTWTRSPVSPPHADQSRIHIDTPQLEGRVHGGAIRVNEALHDRKGGSIGTGVLSLVGVRSRTYACVSSIPHNAPPFQHCHVLRLNTTTSRISPDPAPLAMRGPSSEIVARTCTNGTPADPKSPPCVYVFPPSPPITPLRDLSRHHLVEAERSKEDAGSIGPTPAVV